MNQEQGVVNDKLRRTKERKEYYANQQIDVVMNRCDKEPVVKQNSMLSRINLLILRHASMTLRPNIRLCVRKSPTSLRLSNKVNNNVFLTIDRKTEYG